jgi:DNA end-binding protein Ku
MLHTMYFADEVRDFGEIGKGESATLKEGEMGLALRLIEDLTHDEFKPEQYQDDYRQRVLDLVNAKVEGKEVTTAAPETHRAQVIDLMDALKQSLAKRTGSRQEAPARKAEAAQPHAGPTAPITKKPPMKATKRAADQEKVEKKAQAGKK